MKGFLGVSTFQKRPFLFVQFLIDKHNFTLKIVNQRQTKHGDFRQLPTGKFQITVNNNLNKHQFLLTLVHEIAHHITHQKFGRVQPPWTRMENHISTFNVTLFASRYLSRENFISFSESIYKTPKASTDSDVNLSLALKGNRAETGKYFIFDLDFGAVFSFKNILYKKGNKRRTRYECLNLKNKKVYLFNQNVEVKKTPFEKLKRRFALK